MWEFIKIILPLYSIGITIMLIFFFKFKSDTDKRNEKRFEKEKVYYEKLLQLEKENTQRYKKISDEYFNKMQNYSQYKIDEPIIKITSDISKLQIT